MTPFVLNYQDITNCIELASDGINMHLDCQEKIDLIHKVMYAIAEASQHHCDTSHGSQQPNNQQFTLHIRACRT